MTDAHDALHERAKSIVSAVSEMAETDDLGYNTYVEELRFDDGRKTIGIIDMGDLYHGAFEWDGKEWHDAAYLGDSHALEERILKARDFYSRA